MNDDIYMEKLFSYGTLRYESVQLVTFGRKLQGNPDVLSGFKLSMVEIKNKEVIEKSGEAAHPIISFTGDKTDQVAGFVLDINSEELERADAYEVANYKRINVQLQSGINAWVYVNAKEKN
ncbi:MAG: uncharacterized protein K0R12_1033 [Gammaproteobacteria bacterium]|jgi:gamma-glutamylcyclotransferase (GGCT)/AIG2-like uncharacterized protein YtfP|nr:uncharacterized protein [Gammaproteobacteria bacterium]